MISVYLSDESQFLYDIAVYTSMPLRLPCHLLHFLKKGPNFEEQGSHVTYALYGQ